MNKYEVVVSISLNPVEKKYESCLVTVEAEHFIVSDGILDFYLNEESIASFKQWAVCKKLEKDNELTMIHKYRVSLDKGSKVVRAESVDIVEGRLMFYIDKQMVASFCYWFSVEIIQDDK